MGGAGFILAINLAVAGMFSAAFLLLSSYDSHGAPARWFALSYLCGVANFGFEGLLPHVSQPRFVVFGAFSAFLAALIAFSIGLARKYSVAPPWRLLAVLAVVSLALNLSIYDMPRGSFLRLSLYQAPYVVMNVVLVAIILLARGKRALDWGLATLLSLSAVHFAVKPVLATLYGVGATPQAYLASTYALFSQTMGAVLGVGTGLLMLAILLRDIVVDATARSETDPLSGLLNRRGFEERLADILGKIAKSPMPASLVLADLDHFKAINDRYGHAGGDRVIAGFSDLLGSALTEGWVAGRIGGEEFAVILPGANLAAARLFAEGVRTAFSSLPIDGLPAGNRFTSSFGVAAIKPADGIADVLQRADLALYEAKKAGRDCVRVSREHSGSAGYVGPVLLRAAGLVG
jgi:diguanylate cyclase (GGDEF)-like protein